MSETSGNVLAAVDSVLAGKELKDKPRVFLLLQLCQLSLIFSRDRAEHHWRQLAPHQKTISKELQEDFENLRSVMEETSRAGAKGFAAELITDIETAKNLVASDVEEAKHRLHDCEERLKKRSWPTGKTPVRIALVEAWEGIDRQYALQLIDTIPSNVQDSLIQRINRAKPLVVEEWKIIADRVGTKQAVQIAFKILEEEKAQLLPSRELLLKITARIRDSIQSITMLQNKADLVKQFARYFKLVKLQVGGSQAEVIMTLLEELYIFLAKTSSFDKIWSERFTLLAEVLDLGISLKMLSREMFNRLLGRTPSYLVNFVRAHYAAVTTSSSEVEGAYTALLSETGRDINAEAWFLVTLIGRGLCTEAIGLAERSDRAEDLLPRLRRAWLCTHPESAKKVISMADIIGDPIGEFLLQGEVQDRVTYLVNATDKGKRSVPGAMWAGKGTEDEPEGLRGFWKRLTSAKKNLDGIAMEYMALNPLYSSYRVNTKKEDQFSEQLRLSGYGEYKYEHVDGALLETLVRWGEGDPAHVQSVLRNMWDAIQPDDQILMLDWLRNSILLRCRHIFAADPEMLVQDFIGWFKRELVDRGRSWRIGNRQYFLKFPDTAPLQFCVDSAMNVNQFSPSRRDQILLSGLNTFKADPLTVESAAQIYNTDKDVLDLAPPLELKKNLIEAWQLGIVKNAIPSILKMMIAQGLQQ
ncbi:hypothetical protein AC481_06230 [miscellaneous Crenarchaeota group archaeon SMTZ-80]|nr:MAG: hypothetical protein AC481_06230 [miscellaneous Crenarchaeota group archaeon SMTZ-80]